RDRLCHVAIAAPAFLAAPVAERGADRAIWWRAHGRDRRRGAVRVCRRSALLARTVPPRSRLLARRVRVRQPCVRPLGIELVGCSRAARDAQRHALVDRPYHGALSGGRYATLWRHRPPERLGGVGER